MRHIKLGLYFNSTIVPCIKPIKHLLQKIRDQNIMGSRDREEVSREAHRQSVPRRSNAARKNPQNCWKPVRAVFATAWSVKDERDRLKKKTDSAISSQAPAKRRRRFRDYNGDPLFYTKSGGWYSPFPIEISGIQRTSRRRCNSGSRNMFEDSRTLRLFSFVDPFLVLLSIFGY